MTEGTQDIKKFESGPKPKLKRIFFRVARFIEQNKVSGLVKGHFV